MGSNIYQISVNYSDEQILPDLFNYFEYIVKIESTEEKKRFFVQIENQTQLDYLSIYNFG